MPKPPGVRGFTLIELLVVITILAIAASTALLVFSSVLKGSNQARVTQEVKQNGQAVLDSVEKDIRSSSDVTTDTLNKVITLTLPTDQKDLNSNNEQNPREFIKCVDTNPSVNGWIGKVQKDTGFIPTNDNEYNTITNKDNIKGVDIDNCYFKAYPLTATSPAIVVVQFTVNQGVGAPSRKDFQANVIFQTTISLRTYK